MIENRNELFSKFDMNNEEKQFIEDTVKAYTLTDRAVMVHSAVSTLFLTKQIEQSIDKLIKSNIELAKATNCQSIIMIVLTVSIVAMTLIMVLQGLGIL
jgi:hypothetical protein